MPDTPASPHTDDIVRTICDHLQKFNASGATLSETTDIASDLSVDSMDIMEMVFSLEEQFDVSIPLNALADIRTIGELAALVQKMGTQ